MKLNEILSESVTFSASKFDKEKGYHDHLAFSKEEYVDCWACDGYGIEVYYDPKEDKYYYPDDLVGFGDVSKFEKTKCRYCDGVGKLHDMVSDSPELNVANRNAMVILDMLGIESDYAGVIPNSKLPEIRRKLIKIKNKGIEDYTIDQSKEKSQLKKREVVDDKGIPTIMAVRSPRIYDMGLSEDQINRYIDELLKITDFAQKNDADITWG